MDHGAAVTAEPHCSFGVAPKVSANRAPVRVIPDAGSLPAQSYGAFRLVLRREKNDELAAQVRLGAGHRLNSPALVADGHHARVDGYVSLGVVAAAGAVAIGLPRADPIVGLAIRVIILRITWQAWRTIRTGDSR